MKRRDFVKQAAAVGLTLGGGWYASGGGRSQASDQSAPLRPPGALPEDAFRARCIRCMKCVDACPNHALLPVPADGREAGGTPRMHPRSAACMLCAGQDGEYLKCTEVCPSGALSRIRKQRDEILERVNIGVARIDLELCYSYNNWSCGACFRACPLAGDALTVGAWERPTVHPESCVGCGCCERSCIRYPQAIRVTATART